jgi:hypothetical protein
MAIIGFLRWHGRTHIEFNQLWRRAMLPIEVTPNPPRWLLRRPLLKDWELCGINLWKISEKDKDLILKRVEEKLANLGDTYEIEHEQPNP